MKVTSIAYPTPLEDIEDVENDNIDVFIELEDGITYTVVVTTPLNLIWYMDKENTGYIPAASPYIIVKSLTDENIKNAISNYSEDDAFWLKIIYMADKAKKYFDMEQIYETLKLEKKENDDLFKHI